MKATRWMLAAAMAAALMVSTAGAEELSEAVTEAAEAVSEAAGAADEAMKVTVLQGPTAMGMVGVMNSADEGTLDYECSISMVSAVDEVPPMIAKGTTDLAAVPANLASVLYNNTEGGVQVLAVNTLGVLYIVENSDSISTVEDLRGKTIYASGKGATPEYALNYILSANGIDPETDVTIEWKSEHAECLASLLADEDGIAMLPQPFVTAAQMQADTIRVALDLTEEWDALQTDSEEPSTMITGVLIGRTAYIEEHPDEVAAFLADYQESVAWVTENTEEAAALIGSYEIVSGAIALKALPECHIVYIDGEEMQEKLSGYLAVLAEQNPQSVGGAVPGEDFYYMG